MKQKIAIVGFGTVGQGLAEILLSKKEYLKKKYDYTFDVVAIADFAYGNVYNGKGLDLQYFLKKAKARKKFDKDVKPWDNVNLIKKCNADVVCELTYTNDTGEPAIKHCKAAFETGKSIVTSNKGPVAVQYVKLKKLADKNKVHFKIEGTVVAGTPIINLTEGPLAGCEITKIRGILNGTTNYMLTEMEKGMAYADVLKVAQEKGYAEADPTGDVEGHDARRKVCILANVVMGANLSTKDIPCNGITKITTKDIQKAKKENARWKLIGCVEKSKSGKVTGSVSPEMVPLSHPLAGVMGATNALTFTTDMLGDVTVVGPGAGRTETGYSILTDLLSINNCCCNC